MNDSTSLDTAKAFLALTTVSSYDWGERLAFVTAAVVLLASAAVLNGGIVWYDQMHNSFIASTLSW